MSTVLNHVLLKCKQDVQAVEVYLNILSANRQEDQQDVWNYFSIKSKSKDPNQRFIDQLTGKVYILSYKVLMLSDVPHKITNTTSIIHPQVEVIYIDGIYFSWTEDV